MGREPMLPHSKREGRSWPGAMGLRPYPCKRAAGRPCTMGAGVLPLQGAKRVVPGEREAADRLGRRGLVVQRGFPPGGRALWARGCPHTHVGRQGRARLTRRCPARSWPASRTWRPRRSTGTRPRRIAWPWPSPRPPNTAGGRQAPSPERAGALPAALPPGRALPQHFRCGRARPPRGSLGGVVCRGPAGRLQAPGTPGGEDGRWEGTMGSGEGMMGSAEDDRLWEGMMGFGVRMGCAGGDGLCRG